MADEEEYEALKIAHYGKLHYWEKRYATQTKTFDWYQNYDGIKHIVTQYITKESNILHIGCGNSQISFEMLKEGYSKITNIDFSDTVIYLMQQLCQQKEAPSSFKYETMNVKDLSAFPNDSFDCVIDKGCLDSVLSGDFSKVEAHKMLSEVSRVLNKKGVYLCITYGMESYRKPYLDKSDYEWSVGNPYKLYKPTVDIESPYFDDKDDENYHFIYVCKKGIISHDFPMKGLK